MKYFFIIPVLCCAMGTQAQLYIAPGDSLSIMPGTELNLQDDLYNYGKVYNDGILVLNGSAQQTITGTGISNNLRADNNVLMASDAVVADSLQLSAGQLFDLNNFHLWVNGDLTGTGMIKGSANSSLTLNGNNAGLQFDATNDAQSNALKSLEIHNNATSIQNRLYLFDVLDPLSGTITLQDELVLRSNAAGTARVGVVSASFNYGINGRFVVERYIPGRRAWRLLTAPVTPSSNEKISEAWQDNAPPVTNVNIINSSNNPHPGYGTHVTFGMPATNGYDQGINGNTSIRYLNSTGWNGVPSATNDGSTFNSGLVTDQPGYMLFVRGDRSTALWQATGAVTTATVLRPKGKINTGTLNLPLTGAFGNFRVIGNPYPSSVNFHSLVTKAANQLNGFADAFYVWDPGITGNNAVGGFVAMSYNAAASVAAGHPVYDKNVTASVDNTGDIPSGAAFVIDYAGPAGSLQVQETDKSVYAGNSFFRPMGRLQVSLLAQNADSTVSLNDGVLICFGDRYNDNAGSLRKLANFAENLSVRKDGQLLSIEKRLPVNDNDTIFLDITKMKNKHYRLLFSIDAGVLRPGIHAFLSDAYLKSVTPLRNTDSSGYSFTITADEGSYAPGRFKLIFRQAHRNFLLSATMIAGGVRLLWQMPDTTTVDLYQVERSVNGTDFFPAGFRSSQSLEWSDLHPVPGENFYRVNYLRAGEAAGRSNTVSVTIPQKAPAIQVIPNPVENNVIRLCFSNAAAGPYQFSLISPAGTMVQQGDFYLVEGGRTEQLSLASHLAAGVYLLQVAAPGKNKTVLPVFVPAQ